MSARVFLGLGANLGKPCEQLRRAVAKIRSQSGICVRGVSSLYCTRPVGGEPQPDYWNAVMELTTEWAPRHLLQFGKALERAAGRMFPHLPDAPRELDLDLLLFGARVMDEPELRIPHPRLPERAFVLLPWAEIAPEARHPETGRTAFEMAGRIDATGVVRRFSTAGWR